MDGEHFTEHTSVIMNIAVIAANGRSGAAFVRAALEAGHTIKAGVHKGHAFAAHPALTVLECDATSSEDVARLIKDQDAVVSFIGHVKGSPAHVQTDAMRVLSAQMKLQGIKRLVSLTGTGVRFAGDKITLIDRILNLSIGIIDPARIQDGKDHVEVLKGSELNWTVIRVLKLQNIPAKAFSLKAHGPTKVVVGREEVALAVLRVLNETSFIKEAPIISRA